MSELPRHLAPWAPQLSPLARDLQLTLGPWVARIALAVGRLHTSRTAHSDEPDGVGGLSRRGTYERLLISEWAIADEMPDEFMRRAAMREQLFVELARRSPAGAARSVILFDAGPSQLGNPRIAHLAALVVFARRAVDAGADLHWGVLQNLAGGLYTDFTRDNASGLLAGRSAVDASDALIDAWIEHAGAPGKPDDLWLVGGADIAARARRRGASALTVSDVLVPGARRLELRAHRGPMRHAPISLEMPAADDCVRLLRNPFEVNAPRRYQQSVDGPLELDHSLQLSADARRLLAGTKTGFVAWPISSSQRAVPGRAKRFDVPRGHRLVAAGTYKRRRIAVTIDRHNGVEVHGVARPGPNGRSRVAVAGPWTRAFRGWDAQATTGLPMCALVASPVSRRPVVTFLAPNGELFAVQHLVGNRADVLPAFRADVVHGDVLAFAPASAGVAAVVGDAPGSVSIMLLRPEERSLIATIEHMGKPQVFIGFDRASYPLPGPIAVSVGPWTWHVLHAGETVERVQSTSHVVCGVATRNGSPGLVAFDSEGTLFFIGEHTVELVRTQAAIAYACASAVRENIAWMTEQAAVGVYSLRRNQVLMNLRTGARP